jgi:DNA-binding CsgD family transcriptional regulator
MDPRSSVITRRRAALLMAGHSYRSFARLVRVSEHTVKAAVRGERNGPKARRVIAAIERLNHAA